MSELAVLSELITIRDYLRFAVTQFTLAGLSFGHGTTSAVDDAAFLILETLRLPIDNIDPWLDARLTRAERTQVSTAIENRVVTRKPSAYLTKSAYIGPFRFYVDTRVIVPRSFIGELLCADAGASFSLSRQPQRILDLCTGSGCLAIVAAHVFPDAVVTAADLSRDALAVAEENLKRHAMVGRVSTVETDAFAALTKARYDLILCNPPYVAAAAVAAFPAEYKAEPELAHLGGTDGMDLVRRILETAGRHLEPDGTLVMEIGKGRHILERDYPELPFLWLDTEHSEGEVFVLEASALQTNVTATTKRLKPRGTAGKNPRRA